LSTVRQPKQSMGLAAMELLHAILQGLNPDSRRLPTSVIARASTGPAPADSALLAYRSAAPMTPSPDPNPPLPDP
jgi:hypothetical protein